MELETLDVGMVLQRMYDSEINVRIGWLWDGGLDYSTGTTSNAIWNSCFNTEEIVHTGITDIGEGIEALANDVARRYPNSLFTGWWNGYLARIRRYRGQAVLTNNEENP